MHTSVFISTLLGAGALAFPQLKHAHLHEKKDVVFYSQWQDGPHTLIQEYINENNGVGNALPTGSTSAAVAVNANYAYPHGGHHSWAGKAGKLEVHPAAPTTTAAAAPVSTYPVITSAAVSSTAAVAVVQASPVDSPPVSSSSAAPASSGSDTTTGTTSGTCNPTGGEAWYSPPCTGSSGASALDKMNALRKKWNDTLTDYAWSPGLAQNAHDTAWLSTTWTSSVDSQGKQVETPNGEGSGWVMGHHLFNGSNGQCIAEGNNTKSVGDITPIEAMFLMWICERPNAAIQDMCTATGNTNGDPNCYCDLEADEKDGIECGCGHAMIIMDPGTNSLGCYFMNAVAEADKTDNAVNAVEQAQELGTEGNSAPGMLTCDFTT